MLEYRLIPCLQLHEGRLVKTTNFKKPRYVGDPINVVRIFNDKEVDELVVFDISATVDGRPPDFEYIQRFIDECFMPVCYGGGVKTVSDARRLFNMGIEKVSICSEAVRNPDLVGELADIFGSQSVVACIDVGKGLFGGYRVFSNGGKKRTGLLPSQWAGLLERLGAGELIINCIHRDGTMNGYDLRLIGEIAGSVQVPVVACGGAGRLEDFRNCISEAGASAVSAGSMFVYRGKHRAVLINYPERHFIRTLFEERESERI